MNKKNILLGSIAVLAISTIILKSNQDVEKQYSEITEENIAYSAQEERFLEYERNLTNLSTGQIELSDFRSTSNKLKSRLGKKSANLIELVEEGPDNVGGRTRGICVDVNNSNIVFAGSVSGGLYKSFNKGGSWTRVNSFSENLAISSMDMTSNGTLYIGTGGRQLGEGSVEGGGSGNYLGDGIWQSTDAGSTFTKVAGTNGWDISNVLAHPTSNKIFVIGSGLGVKIYNGSSFSTASGISSTSSLTDIEISPDGNTLVCGKATTYISTDGGSTFSSKSGSASQNKIANGSNARYAISHETNANGKYNIFASLASNTGTVQGIYMSPDSGQKWYEIGPGGSTAFDVFGPYGQGNYDNTITVIQGKPNEILVGGIDLWHWELTTDLTSPWGQWTRVSQWAASPFSTSYVHADQHEMKWSKDGDLYFGNDGGVFTFIAPFPEDVTYLTFKHLARGYNTLQFYSLAHGPEGQLLAGAQDNGTQYNDHTGNTHMEAVEVNGGDGFDCAISQLDSDGQISSVYYTSIVRSDDAGGNYTPLSVPCGSAVPGGLDNNGCGGFFTYFELQETLNDSNSKDSVLFAVIKDTLILDGASFDFTYTSSNFGIELDGSFDNTTGADLTLTAGTEFTLVDPVQSLYALSIPGTGVFVTRDVWRFGKTTDWWKVLGSENGYDPNLDSFGRIQNYAISMKFSVDMQYLYIGMSQGDIWRVDGLGDAYRNEVADLTYAFEVDISLDKRTIKDIGGTIYVEPFDLDFINNTYYNPDDDKLIEFKLNVTKIRTGSGRILGLSVDPNDSEHLVAAISGFGNSTNPNIISSSTAASTSSTASFTSIQGDLDYMPVFDVLIDKNDPNLIFAGTLYGMWYSTNGGVTWSDNNDEIGLVPVFKVNQDINDSNNGTDLDGAIYISTHGKGYWSTNKHLVSVEENVIDSKDDNFKSEIQIFPNPVNNIANVTFEINSNSNVSINVMSIEGKIVRSNSIGVKPPGKHRLNINTEGLPNGIYVIQVKAGNANKTGKFIKL